MYLEMVTVNDELFNKILADNKLKVWIADEDTFKKMCVVGIDIDSKKPVWSSIVKSPNRSWLICSYSKLANYVKGVTSCWKDVVIRSGGCDAPVVQFDITGKIAHKKHMDALNRFYSDEEINNILNSYTDSYDENFIQFHYLKDMEIGNIYRVENVKCYDINGAHCDALTEIFPKAANIYKTWFKRRKESIKYKMLPNYSVGYLKHLGFEGVYNHIVQRTTAKLYKAVDSLKGELIYANTDGFKMITKDSLKTSKRLGDFKLEYHGPLYIYYGNNYYIIQQGDKLIGNVPLSIRNKIDLSSGKTVEFNWSLIKDKKGKVIGRLPENVKEVTLGVKEYENEKK